MKNNCVYRIALSDLKMGLKCCNKLNTQSYEDATVRIKKSVLDFSSKANVRIVYVYIPYRILHTFIFSVLEYAILHHRRKHFYIS